MIALEERIARAADALFSIEHKMFAAKLGLIEDCGELLEGGDLVGELVFAIDELSWEAADGAKKRLAIQLIALLWEYSSPTLRESVRELLILSLSRLGVTPSTQMIDASYKGSNQYAAIGSFRSKLAAVTMQLPLQLRVGSVAYQLTEFQKRAFEAISHNKLTGVSAPTSAGKSFAIYLAVVQAALRSNRVSVYIVPTISLVNQVSADLREKFDAHGLNDWTVANSFRAQTSQVVFVLTQERAIVALEHGLTREKLSLLIIDEVQNLERVSAESEVRSKILFDFLHDMRHSKLAEKVILSGPRLENIGKVGEEVFGTASAEEQALDSPVASLTYSIEKIDAGGSFIFHQHREWSDKKASLPIEHAEEIRGLGTTEYGDEYYSALSFLVNSLGDHSANLIFSPTTDQARKLASTLSGYVAVSGHDEDLASLSGYLQESIHPRHRLVELVRKGVAFHTGSLPPHARLVIEQAFGDGLLKDIVCTTTLMQGVNLPANNVFIRSPNLYIRKNRNRGNPELSQYEFANLRGRAGRLLRDFVGRTIVLDETAFHDDSQAELFQDAYKTLNLTYGDIFDRNREEIVAELLRIAPAETDGGRFISTFVRQTLFRHQKDASERLRRVGINLPASTLEAAHKLTDALSISKEVILANRYWDPFDLDRIARELVSRDMQALPPTVWEADSGLLCELIEFQAEVAPAYFKRYLDAAPTQKFCKALALSAISWGRETPLKSIIENRKFGADYEDQIDNQVELIYKKVVYGLSAILKPISSIVGAGDAFLASLESGVYHPVSQYLVSVGLYRETAVYLRRNYFGGIRGDDPELAKKIASRAAVALTSLDKWTRRQVEATLGRKLRGEEHG